MSTRSGSSRNRTIVVWIFIIVAVLAGLNALLDAARYMGWLPVAQLGNLEFALPSANWLGAIMSAIVGVIWFAVAKWLYDLNPQGWLFVVIMAILNLILLFMAIIGKSTFQAVSLGLLLNGVLLLLAFLPQTQKAFGRA
jgi:hypothetical protein